MNMQAQQFIHSTTSSRTGLSEKEVSARRARGLGNRMPIKTSRSYAQIVRENIFNPLNTLLYILGISLISLGKVSDALISVGVVVLNVVVSVIQEVRAKRTLDQISLLTRPSTTVMRDGQERSVDPGDIVIGDVLVLRPGDQIVVDGPILSTDRLDVDESLLTGESDLVEKRKGDLVYSGSFCVSGTALFQAEKVGSQSVAYGLTAGARAFRRVLTPLQSEIFLTIRIIVVAAIFLELLMLLSTLTSDIPFVEFVQRSVVIVGIVPIGLLLAITVSYTLGAVRIVRQGALVQQSNAIESLSNVNVLCMDKTGTLTTNALEVSAVHALNEEDATQLRQQLGDFVASSTVGNTTSKAIGAACPGQQRHIQEEIPFSSAYKWSGLALDDDAMRGMYILGAVEMLEPALSKVHHEQLQTFVKDASDKGLRVLLFASTPEIVPLRDSDDQPTLPSGLIPSGLVTLRDRLRTDAQDTLTSFTEAGIQFKIISGDNQQTVAALAKQVGLRDDVAIISGLDLAKMDATQFSQAAADTTIFGRITPQQKEHLVQTLRDHGHYVAMIGDGVNDVLSLKKANLGIAMQSGSQATRNVADIVLLNDSFSSLPHAFREGQRIRHGMQDILSLFLARVLFVAILIIELLMIGEFPFEPKQVSILALLTVGAPTLVIAVWAYPQTSIEQGVGRSLWQFVLPAAITVSTIALFVYLGEYYVTSGLRMMTLLDGNKQLSEAAALAGSVLAARAAAQTSLTTFTVICGILLLLFIEPPSKFWVGGHQLRGDKRFIFLALAMLAAYVILLAIPPLRNLFDLTLLGFFDYLFIGLLVVVWIFVVRWFWRSRLLDRFIGLK